MSKLYFIALLPDSEISHHILHIKNELWKKYNLFHSLNVPSHITLIPPFQCNDENLMDIRKKLDEFACHQHPFEVMLDGFGHFRQKVIYINVFSNPNNSITRIYASLRELLRNSFPFFNSIQENITPHLTVANRDVHKEKFDLAWKYLNELGFQDIFHVNNLWLMEHQSGNWVPYLEFKFQH